MCDAIRFKDGTCIRTVQQFQDMFGIDAKPYMPDGDNDCMDSCLCSIDLVSFFKGHHKHQFYYDCGDWWEIVDCFAEENEFTKQMFKLDDILEFQTKNDVQIIRGEDYQYMCYINGIVYATGLTPMFALTVGIKLFNNKPTQ